MMKETQQKYLFDLVFSYRISHSPS